jgi:WD40 repeat protein/serine/threonine protein kinase
MSPSQAEAESAASAEHSLAEVVEELTAKLKAGEAVDLKAYFLAHPLHAAELHRLVPALRLLADFSHSAASEGCPAAAGTYEAASPDGTLGDFRILREVGRGGMGVVYEAEQISLSRRVALKVLPFASTLDPRQLQRFKNEAQAAAHLHHTHIVPVHATGCERGVHYYAMQFIEGQTLAAVIAELRAQAHGDRNGAAAPPRALAEAAQALLTGPWIPGEQAAARDGLPAPGVPSVPGDAPAAPSTTPRAGLATERLTQGPAFFRTVAHLGVQAAEALEHAHQLGIVHRDVKPANLMVDGGGKLWITDFGLAHCQGQAGLTMTGDLVGTLRYMSPEQALARRLAVDHRTDVYSLGVTLYELLTLKPAVGGRDREELLRQIAFEEPRRPRQRNKSIPAELETIVLKAMEKNPADRYGTAGELGEDLRRFLEDRPIRARRPTPLQRLRKWSRRHRSVVLTLAASLAVLLLGLATAALVAIVHINAALGQAKHNEDQERKAREEAEYNLYLQMLARVQREREAGNAGLAEKLLDDSKFQHLHDWGWHYLKRLRYGSLPPLRHSSCMCGLAMSRDGGLLAAGGSDGWVKLWNTQTWDEVRKFRAHGQHIHRVAFSPDGRQLATTSWDGTVKMWEVATGRWLYTLEHREDAGDEVGSVVFSPDSPKGSWIASAGFEAVKIWDAATGEFQRKLPGPFAWQSLAISPDGRRLAVSNNLDQTVQLWDTSGRIADWTPCGDPLGPHAALVIGLAFSADGAQLAAACGQFMWTGGPGEVAIWDVASRQRVHSLRGHVSGAFAVAFTPDGRYVASGGVEDAQIKLWDLQKNGREVLTLRGHWDCVWGLVFSRDGRRLYSAGFDQTVRVWDAAPLTERDQPEVRKLTGHTGPVATVAFSPDGRRVVSGSMDGTIRVWDAVTGHEVRKLTGHSGPVRGLAFRPPDGLHLASVSQGLEEPSEVPGEVKLWDTNTWEKIPSPDLKDDGFGMAFRSDGRRLALVHYEDVTVWDMATRKPVRILQQADGFGPICAAFGPAGQLASSGVDGSVHVWDLSVRQEISLFAPLVLPPDITRLPNVWCATTGLPTKVLRAHQGRAMCVAFSPDGAYLASAGLDGIVKLWDTRTYQSVELPRLHRGGVQTLAFRPDGKRLATAGSDAVVRIWDVATQHLVLELRGHTDAIYALAFSPDGRTVASGGWDGTVRLWDAEPLP